MKTIAVFLTLLFGVATLSPGHAVEPSEVLPDSLMEKRARSITAGLRCVVCQNQSIDDSNAEWARDVRVLVRARLMDGDTDNEVVDYIVSRYGDFVLLKPPFKAATAVLWAGPGLIALIGLITLIFYFRRQSRAFAAAEAGRTRDGTA